MNEEVRISLTANTKPFQESMKNSIKTIDYAIQSMTDFNAMIDNANKKSLKDMASTVKSQIKDTQMIIKDMQKELVIASSTEGNTKWTEDLRSNILVAQQELNTLKDKLKQVQNAGGMTLFEKSINKVKNGLKGVKENVSTTSKMLGRMVFSSMIFRGIALIRQGLSNATELSDSATNKIGAMSNAIAGTLVPVIDTVTRAVQKAFVWVAGLINFLSGGKINLIQKGIDATNKKIQEIGSSAKKSGKSVKDGLLSGLDEITNIETSSGDASSSSPSSDMTTQLGVLGELNSMMEQMNALDFSWAEPLKSVWQFLCDYGDVLAIILLSVAAAILVVNVAMWALSANPVVLIIAGIVLAIGLLIAIIVLLSKHWDEIWAKVKEIAGNIWNKIKELCQAIGQWFADLWNGIKSVFNTVVSFFVNIFTSAWNGVKNAWNGVKTFFSNIWTGIKNIFNSVGTWFSNIFTSAWNGIKNAFSKVTGFFQGIWNSIKSIFSNVGQAIGNAITNTVKKAVNAVLSTAVKIINGFISAINFAIGIINKIPGVNIKKLEKLSVPSFDVGTNYVPQDMLAMVHKGERIVPEKYNNDDWTKDVDMTETNNLLIELIDAVNSKNLIIDGTTIGRASVNYIRSESRRRGESII